MEPRIQIDATQLYDTIRFFSDMIAENDDRSHTPRWPTVTPTEAARVPKAVEIARGILATLRDAPFVIADALEESGVDVRGLRELQYPDRDILEWLMAISKSK